MKYFLWMGDYNISLWGPEQNKIKKLRKQSTPNIHTWYMNSILQYILNKWKIFFPFYFQYVHCFQFNDVVEQRTNVLKENNIVCVSHFFVSLQMTPAWQSKMCSQLFTYSWFQSDLNGKRKLGYQPPRNLSKDQKFFKKYSKNNFKKGSISLLYISASCLYDRWFIIKNIFFVQIFVKTLACLPNIKIH